MASVGLQIVGIALSVMGLLGAIVSCVLPMWKMGSFIDKISVTVFYWDGLWMTCMMDRTGRRECKDFDSMLALKQDQQAAQALTIISIIVAILALFISIVGAKCTNCIEDRTSKAKIMVVSGVLFLISGLLFLIPVCWYASTIIRDFNNPQVPAAQKWELGPCLFMGWGATAFLLFGGGMLCCSFPPADRSYTPRAGFSAPNPPTQLSYNMRDYV